MDFLKNKKGFTLLEIMAVLSVISIGMLGIVSLVIQNIQAQNVNQSYLVASMLAQEGLELVRNIRDENWLQERDWKFGDGAGSPTDIVQDLNYAIDYHPTGISDNGGNEVNSITDPRAHVYLNGGFYDNSETGQITPFSRLITVADNGGYLDVDALVQWKERGRIHEYKASTVLYDWR
jgi:prepilin-type N-terminal cleavage/methylation domain-containing protein